MIEQSKTRIPAALYAAAGAGDLAYRRLRKLPAAVHDLTGKAGTDFRADRFREVAKRKTAAVVAGAQAARGRAVAAYAELVAHGERVVGGGVVQAAEGIEPTTVAAEGIEPTTVAVEPARKPVKRTRTARK